MTKILSQKKPVKYNHSYLKYALIWKKIWDETNIATAFFCEII